MSENKAALEAEAEYADRREFDYKGKTYVIEGDVEEWDLEVMRAFENGKSIAIAEGLVGAKQWALFMAGKPRNKDFAAFSEALFGALGTSEGESAD